MCMCAYTRHGLRDNPSLRRFFFARRSALVTPGPPEWDDSALVVATQYSNYFTTSSPDSRGQILPHILPHFYHIFTTKLLHFTTFSPHFYHNFTTFLPQFYHIPVVFYHCSNCEVGDFICRSQVNLFAIILNPLAKTPKNPGAARRKICKNPSDPGAARRKIYKNCTTFYTTFSTTFFTTPRLPEGGKKCGKKCCKFTTFYHILPHSALAQKVIFYHILPHFYHSGKMDGV